MSAQPAPMPPAEALPSHETQLLWLNEAQDDLAIYAEFWIACVQAIGATCTLQIANDQERILIGLRTDGSERERSSLIRLLQDHMAQDPARRPYIVQALKRRGWVHDMRPADLPSVKAALRAYLPAGGRLVMDERGSVTSGGPIYARLLDLNTPPAERDALLQAATAMSAGLRRLDNHPYLIRVIRALGKLSGASGLIVLEIAK